MCEVGTSRHGNRFNLGKQNHFLPSLVPPWHFCTISDNPPTTRRYDPCKWCEGFSIDHRWNWVSWVLRHVSIWDCMSWWWWNNEDNRASQSRCTSSLPHWTYPTHPSSSRSVPLLLRSFHLVIEPRVYCHHRSWCESPSWFIFHSSIFCTCSYLQCDNTWVHTRERIESHLTSVLPRLCNQTERKTCFNVFSSLLHRVHEFRQRLFSLVTEFMTIPLIFEISFVLCLASHNQILTLSFGITNLFTRSCMFCFLCYFHWPPILIPYLVWHLCSWIRNELFGELPIAHVILGCQSFPSLSANLDLLSSIGI